MCRNKKNHNIDTVRQYRHCKTLLRPLCEVKRFYTSSLTDLWSSSI